MPETAIPTGIPIHRLPAATPATGRKPPIGYKTHQEPITFIFHPLDTKSLQIERPPNDTLHEHEFLPPGSGSVAQPPKYLKELMLFNLNPAPSCIHLREEPVIITSGHRRSAFIVPIQLVMTAFEKEVCRDSRYQVYEHTLIRRNKTTGGVLTRDTYLDGAAQYIGITKRSWQERYKEHRYASQRGSQLRFHRALREELFPFCTIEHEILRAGLREGEALRIEEVEVDQRTLYPIHQNGLNMIPGGNAGIKFIAAMSQRRPDSIDPDKKEVELEEVIINSLRQRASQPMGTYTNERVAELWREDIRYRISVMTNRSDRLSYQQILYARIWKASGWDTERIHAALRKLEDRPLSIEQVIRLLDGSAYDSIPFVLVDGIDPGGRDEDKP